MAPRPDEKAEAEDDRSRTGRIKDFAYEKTPEKLKNATDLQVRFRTGFVYVALSVLCILVSDWTTVAFLVATAGITAGEFYYRTRSCPTRCSASSRPCCTRSACFCWG